MRSAAAAYIAVVALLATNTLFDTCLCEQVGCVGGSPDQFHAFVGGINGCCGADQTRQQGCDEPLCCELTALEAVPVPIFSRPPDEAAVAALTPVTKVADSAPALLQLRHARDGPTHLPAAPEVAPRVTRAPPPFAP